MRLPSVCRLIAASLFCLLAAGEASARQTRTDLEVFAVCDGFGAPSASGDGMSGQAKTLAFWQPGAGYGTTLQSKVKLGLSGLAACDTALDSSLLPSRYWQRRVNLMRARAFHLLALGRGDEAVSALEAAEASVSRPDVFYERSQGLGFGFIRAYLKRQNGDVAGATALALETWRKRPYDWSTAVSAIVAMGPDADFKDLETILQAISKQHSNVAGFYYSELFERGRFADAVRLQPTLMPFDKAMNMVEFIDIRDTSGLPELFDKRVLREGDTARFSGMQAYILAALGRPEESRAALKFARDRIAAITTPLPATPQRGNGKLKAQPARWIVEASNRRIGLLSADLDAWERLIEMRAAVAANPTAVERFLALGEAKPSRASLDILELALAGPLASDLRARVVDERARLAEVLAADRRDVWTKSTNLDALFASLPEAETAGRLEAYREPKPIPAKDKYPYPKADPATVAFEYWGYESTLAMTQETVLLQAAEYARQQKQKGFILLRRDDWQEMTQTAMYGVPTGTPRLTGYRSTILVLPVDPEALPAAYADAGWRVIDAKAVYAALMPIYGPKAKTR